MIPIPLPGDSPNDINKKILWALLASNFGISTVNEYNAAVQQVLTNGGDVTNITNIAAETPAGGGVSRVGGFTKVVDTIPTISAAVHAANDVVVAPTQIEAAFRSGIGSGVLHSVTVRDTAVQAAELVLAFWTAQPIGHPVVNAPFVNVTGVGFTLLSTLKIEAADYVTVGTNVSIASKSSLGLPLFSFADKDLWFSAFTTGTPTYGSTSALRFSFGFLQD